MSEAVRGVVISHGSLSQALVEAVRCITGDVGDLMAISNEGCNRATLTERVEAAAGTGPRVLFVDLPAGSCFLAAAGFVRSHADTTRVVAGVNLAMLLDFVHHRTLPINEVVARAVAAGGRAVQTVAL